MPREGPAEMTFDGAIMEKAFHSSHTRNLFDPTGMFDDPRVLAIFSIHAEQTEARIQARPDQVKASLRALIHIGFEIGYEYARLVHERELMGL